MKKTTFLFNIIAVTLVIGSFSSCKKEHEHSAPIIVLESPINNQTFILGDTVHIEGTATDENELHEMSIFIKNHTGDTLFSDYPYVHAMNSHNFHYHYLPTDTGMFHIHITASDHDNQLSHLERVFHVMM